MFLLLGLGLTIASVVLNIISLALPYWYYGGKDGYSFYFGLFKVCASSPTVSACNSFSDGGSTVNATKAFEIIALLAIVAALVCGALKLFSMRDKRILLQVGAILACIAGGMMFVGAIIFASDKDLKHLSRSLDLSLHSGFALAIVSAIAALAAGLLMILEFRRGDN